MHGFCHMDLTTQAPEEARDFYAALFGWTFTSMPMGPDAVYHGFETGDGPGGGIGKPQGPAPTAWVAYVAVEDVVGSLVKAGELGATVVQPRTAIPGMGWLAVLKDPTGAVIGIWQADDKAA